MKVDTCVLTITLDRGSAMTLGRQIYQQIRELILAGRLTGGARLPSTRAFGDDHGVSRTVVLAAYDQLLAEGYLEAHRGSGMYVAAIRVGSIRDPVKRTGGRRIESESELPAGCPFDVSAPVVDRFPHAVWARMLARGWRRHGAAMSVRPDAKGLITLREALAEYVHGLRGVRCDPEQILVTEGYADALALTAALVKDRAPRIQRPQAWIEDPGHIGGRRALQRHDLEPIEVTVDSEGLQVSLGERRAPRAKLALVTPARQFPLGMEMSLNRRLALLAWGRRAGALIVEDDYDCELRFAGHPLASLLSLDENECVVTIGSFSKTCFPGLRLGYLVAAQDVADALAEIRRRRGFQLAGVAQPALAEFMGSGALTRHLRAVRRDVRMRGQALVSKLGTTFGNDLVVQPHEVGTHVTIILGARIAARTTDMRIASAAAKYGLHLSPLSKQYAGASKRIQGFLLGYGGWSVQAIEKAVETLERSVARSIARRSAERK